jgi:hypothetical protein
LTQLIKRSDSSVFDERLFLFFDFICGGSKAFKIMRHLL